MIMDEFKLLIRGKAEYSRKKCSYKSLAFGEPCKKDGCPKITYESGKNTIGNYQKAVCTVTGDSITEYS